MFESIKDKLRGYNREVAVNMKRLPELHDADLYHNILVLFKSKEFQSLPDTYRMRYYDMIINIVNNKAYCDYYEFQDIIRQACTFLYDERFNGSPNFLSYLDILLDYPSFPILKTRLISEHDDKNLLLYLRIEAKLYFLDNDFTYYLPEFEDIILNEKLKRLNLLDVIVNGIINTQLSIEELIEDINNLLKKEEDCILIILKLFQAPSNQHYSLVSILLRDEEVFNSEHLLEMIDMVYATPYEELDKLEFSITHKLVYEEMPFSSACKNYNKEAMKILDETPNIKSYTRVRVPIYLKKN